MASYLTMSIRTPASSYVLRNAATRPIETDARHFRITSASTFWPFAAGDPRKFSTGCERISTALTFSFRMRSSSSSGFMSRPPKLYGTFRPIWTPATFEFGFGARCAHAIVGPRRPVPGIAAAASLPRSRRVSFICAPVTLQNGPPEGGPYFHFLLSSTFYFPLVTAQYNPLMLLQRTRIIAFFITLGAAVGYAAQVNNAWPPGLQQVPEQATPLLPEEALKKFHMPPGYRVELVASEPLVQEPVMINWDGEGRMWVVEMPGFMRDIEGTGERDPIGRIVVLEDTNKDGRMDKRTVFQDGLVLARSLRVLDRGVLVAEPPNLWLFQDTDGDLRADRKERVADQYGRREANVEHTENGLLWALDNRIHSSEGTTGLRLKNGKFEISQTLSRGQWGITQDDAGRMYRTTNESALHVDLVPAHYYVRHPNLLRTRGSYESLTGPNGELNDVWPIRPTRGVNRGYQYGILRPDGTLARYTSVCAPTVFRGDRLPAELYGNVFVVDPTVNLVSRFILRDGPDGLVAEKAYRDVRGEFLASTDELFRPVNLSMGPDGTLYVVDMYRGIVEHKGYITEYLREYIVKHQLAQFTGRGRIYRIVHDTTRRDMTPLPKTTPSA